jgi:uncharacterized membrane protein YedE/YeeE
MSSRSNGISLAIAALIGALFGGGLLVSGMTEPAKIVGFLDPLHGWDPSLAFVMGGAVLVNALAFRWIRRRRPWFDVKLHLPTRKDIDVQLLAGAAVFGIGWGLGGLCPGPGLVAAASGNAAGIAFVLAMLAGMLLQHRTTRTT